MRLCIALLLLLSSVVVAQDKEIRITYQELFDAIREVETGSEPNGGRDAIGDGGDSIGPYQIQKAYWIDATEYDKTIGGVYKDVKDKDYAEKIMRSYWKRYGRKQPSAEELSRLHNGGHAGCTTLYDNTTKYWEKVRPIILRNRKEQDE